MDLSSFSGALPWVISHGYILMFLAMSIEGPIITAAAAFAAALGHFNIFIIFILAILGDMIPDTIYYAIGYWGRISVVNKFGHRFGLSTQRMEKMENLIKHHGNKTMVAIKLTPVLAVPGLMLVGLAKMPLVRYLLLCFLISLPKIIVFSITGYYFGYAYSAISKYLDNGSLIILGGMLLVLVIYLSYKKVAERLAAKIEKI